MKKLLPLLFITLLFTSCHGVWRASDKDVFFEACMDDTKTWLKDPEKAKTYCTCFTKKVHERYPDIKDAMENIEVLVKAPEMQTCKTEILK